MANDAYSAQNIENKWYKYWEERKYFHAEPDHREHYSIVIPPPNITGALHLGHALNNTIQDVLIRFHRMKGRNTCWIPGTDHAGIATQSVVEKRLYQQEGKTRHDIGREALLQKILDWKEQFGHRIVNQLKKMGFSCDWDRLCFTMDDNLSLAVRTVFLQLFNEGLIYRGKRLINWCPGCRTALSNDELVHQDVDAKMWQIRYPIENSDQYITVATTRPETMLGDMAVAVHSKDERYTHLIGKNCILPLANRPIPIIADDLLANPEKGTGAVKVTPGHDPNDYNCGLRNQLPMMNILNEDGTLNENAGEYEGLKVQEAREKVLSDLKTLGLLGEIQDIVHPVAHCYRSDDIVEPYLSDQWFVKMQPLVEMARQAVVDGEVTFFPAKQTDDYLRWLDNTPDWCISRQIWWGHRIPIWYCRNCHPEIELSANGEPIVIPENAQPILPETAEKNSIPCSCPVCGKNNLIQDPNVLDTWFSSQLWPFSTLGWPNITNDLEYYYPTNVLVTARDIIALWVARMVMMGKKFLKQKPFSHVYIHGTIQDENGDIMSKSRGNGVDPVNIIDGGIAEIHGKAPFKQIPADRIEHYQAYGCDSLRYGLMSMSSGQGQDIKILIQRNLRNEKTTLPHYDVEIPLFEEGRRFCNKIWQACHGVVFRNTENLQPQKEQSTALEDQWLNHKLHELIKSATTSLEEYKIGEMCNELYHFFWDDVCSWYLEIIKPRLWGEQGDASKEQAKWHLVKTMDTFLRMMHPIMPFLTEELWQTLKNQLPEHTLGTEEACIIAPWPDATQFPTNKESLQIVELAREISAAINNIRAEQKLKPSEKIAEAYIASTNNAMLEKLQNLSIGVQKLTKVEKIYITSNMEKPDKTASRVLSDILVYIPLAGMMDIEKEKEKLNQEIHKLQEQIARLETKLANTEYTSKAPAQVVEKDRNKLADMQKRSQQWQEQLQSL